ncbi:MAG: dihydrodipicolinate synthase family protein [Thermodesulfobacteriota bacterium]
MVDSNKRGRSSLLGIIPALITPMHEDGRVDERLLEKQVSYLSTAGVHGFLINGTTGEGPLLSREERRRIFEVVRSVSGSQQFLCLTCPLPSTDLVMDEIAAFESLQPDFIVVTTPYYYTFSQKEIIRHFQKIASRSPFPVIAYNIPQCTFNKIEYDAMLEISSLENVVGLKDSSGDFVTFSRVMFHGTKKNFALLQGEDYLDADSLMIGSPGIVTGLGNVWIEPYITIYQAAQKGDFSTVRKIQAKINKLYGVIQTVGDRVVPAIKGATSLLGRSEKWVRAPMLSLEEGDLSRIRKILEELSLKPAQPQTH